MEYLELQGLIENGIEITDVEKKNNRVYFRIGGHLFHTFGRYIDHEKSPLFDHPFVDFESKRLYTPEGIEEEEKRNEEHDKKWDLFDKYKVSLYKLIFLRALHRLNEHGEEEFIKYIEHHFDIMENDDNCQTLLKMLEAADKEDTNGE